MASSSELAQGAAFEVEPGGGAMGKQAAADAADNPLHNAKKGSMGASADWSSDRDAVDPAGPQSPHSAGVFEQEDQEAEAAEPETPTVRRPATAKTQPRGAGRPLTAARACRARGFWRRPRRSSRSCSSRPCASSWSHRSATAWRSRRMDLCTTSRSDKGLPPGGPT